MYIWNALHKKGSFPLKISSVNMTKSAGNCGFTIKDFFSKWDHLLKKSLMENFIFCAWYHLWDTHAFHCLKSVRIRTYSGPHFPAFGLNFRISPYSVRMRKNTDKSNSGYEHFLRTVYNILRHRRFYEKIFIQIQ